MYASAARNLHVAGSPQDKLTVLDNLKQKLKTKRVWVDAAILNAFNWGAAEIEARTKLLAAEAYSNVWKI